MIAEVSRAEKSRAEEKFAGQIPGELWEYIDAIHLDPVHDREKVYAEDLVHYMEGHGLNRRPGSVWAFAIGLDCYKHRAPKTALKMSKLACRWSSEISPAWSNLDRAEVMAQCLGVLGGTNRLIGEFEKANAAYSAAHVSLRYSGAPKADFVELWIRKAYLSLFLKEFDRAFRQASCARDSASEFWVNRADFHVATAKSYLNSDDKLPLVASFRMYESLLDRFDSGDGLYLVATFQGVARTSLMLDEDRQARGRDAIADALNQYKSRDTVFAHLIWINAEIQQKSGEFDDSEHAYNEAIAIFTDNGLPYHAAHCLIDLVDLYLEINDSRKLIALASLLLDFSSVLEIREVCAALQILGHGARKGVIDATLVQGAREAIIPHSSL